LAGGARDFDDFRRHLLDVQTEKEAERKKAWWSLEQFSGFPEPFLSGRDASYRRWSSAYTQQLIREDIRDLTNIQAIGDLETLYSNPKVFMDFRGGFGSLYFDLVGWLSEANSRMAEIADLICISKCQHA